MKKTILLGFLATGLCGSLAAQNKQTDKPQKKDAAMEKPGKAGEHQGHGEMASYRLEDIKWSPGPKTLKEGTQMSVLIGDPSKAGQEYTIRLKMPAGFKVMPHWHPKDEHVTVLSGKFAAGMGEKFDEASLKEFPVGSFVQMPKKMNHYAMAIEETIIQLHGTGPFEINYVNPADDPRKKGQGTK